MAAIQQVNRKAFSKPGKPATEHHIVDALRKDGQLCVSLVAVVSATAATDTDESTGHKEEVVGHVAMSPVAIGGANNCGWYGLGPVAVMPHAQKQGVGSALIRAAHKLLSASGANGFVVLGDPRYYSRFGYKVTAGITFPDAPKEYFMALPLTGVQAREEEEETGACSLPQGVVRYHDSFYAEIPVEDAEDSPKDNDRRETEQLHDAAAGGSATTH